jgi:hypothetical protein
MSVLGIPMWASDIREGLAVDISLRTMDPISVNHQDRSRSKSRAKDSTPMCSYVPILILPVSYEYHPKDHNYVVRVDVAHIVHIPAIIRASFR